MIKRPGFLGEFSAHTPRQVKYAAKRRPFNGLGFFGKGFIAPPPAPTSSNVQVLTDAVNARTGKYYEQDIRCPAGEKWTTINEPCKGQDCCDGSGCDPEGTVYPEEGCEDDPDFRELPDEPPGGFTSCNDWRAAGYPEPCDQTTCPSCFAPPPQQTPANLQTELLKLQAESQAVDAMPSVPAPGSSYMAQQYTGSIPTAIPSRATRTEPTEQDRLMELVEAHEAKKAAQPVTPMLPPVVAPKTPAPVQEEEVPGLFSWLRSALFGSPSSVDGLGEWTSRSTLQYVVPVLVGVALAYYLKKHRTPAFKKSKKK